MRARLHVSALPVDNPTRQTVFADGAPARPRRLADLADLHARALETGISGISPTRARDGAQNGTISVAPMNLHRPWILPRPRETGKSWENRVIPVAQSSLPHARATQSFQVSPPRAHVWAVNLVNLPHPSAWTNPSHTPARDCQICQIPPDPRTCTTWRFPRARARTPSLFGAEHQHLRELCQKYLAELRQFGQLQFETGVGKNRPRARRRGDRTVPVRRNDRTHEGGQRPRVCVRTPA